MACSSEDLETVWTVENSPLGDEPPVPQATGWHCKNCDCGFASIEGAEEHLGYEAPVETNGQAEVGETVPMEEIIPQIEIPEP